MNKKLLKTGEKILGAIFDYLMFSVDGLAKSFDRREACKIIYGELGFESGSKEPSKLFYELERRGYIKNDLGNEQSFKFTNKAKLAIIDKVLATQSAESTAMFVSFDIPESLHRGRDLFRRAIKRMGFKQIQKSLWVCNKNVGSFIDLAASEYKVSNYIVYIASNKTNIDDYISKIIKE